MRNVIVGSFVGFVLAAAFLAACGSSGNGGTTNATVDELVQQVEALTQQVTALEQQLASHELDDNAHHTPSAANETPWLGLHWCIALQGTFPSRNLQLPGDPGTELSVDPLLGGIGLFAGNFAPRGWALCEGQLLDISANSALFSILGTTYGGDGRTNFALPDLRGRTPVGVGTGPGLAQVQLGQKGP